MLLEFCTKLIIQFPLLRREIGIKEYMIMDISASGSTQLFSSVASNRQGKLGSVDSIPTYVQRITIALKLSSSRSRFVTMMALVSMGGSCIPLIMFAFLDTRISNSQITSLTTVDALITATGDDEINSNAEVVIKDN